MIAEEYGIGKPTVGDIENYEMFVSTTERGPGSRKTEKQPENFVLDCALFKGFIQQ